MGSELISLAEAGIRSINLDSRLDLAWTDSYGNSATRALNFEKDNDTFKDWLDKAEKAAKAKDAKTEKNPYKLRFY